MSSMEESIRIFYKEAGLTMNQFMDDIKSKNKHDKYAYTARLDPMARGYIPVLVDEQCKDIKKHLKSNKIYNVKVVIGIQTDSDDPLGLIEKMDLIDDFDSFLLRYQDKFIIEDKTLMQKFHYFSTKALSMRKLNKFEESYHEVQIYKSSIVSTGIIQNEEWKKEIIGNICKIDNKKNFRQEEIIRQWQLFDQPSKSQECIFTRLPYIELELVVSSGFFVRQFVRDLSNEISQPMLAYDIFRKAIF